jgi:hypothetical protein
VVANVSAHPVIHAEAFLQGTQTMHTTDAAAHAALEGRSTPFEIEETRQARCEAQSHSLIRQASARSGAPQSVVATTRPA